MKFNPNYITKEKEFEIELNKETLVYKTLDNKSSYPQNKELTENKVRVYNNSTDRVSDKSLYLDKKGRLYFKGNNSYWNKSLHSKYYIDELKEINNENS